MSKAIAKNLLLTRTPGCGKTTVIRRLVERLANRRVAGFYTQEIRPKGQRVGFEVRGLRGGHGILAHVGFQSSHRVGRYGVDLGALEQIVRDELILGRGNADVYIIDEIGKMECFSPAFVQAVSEVLDSRVPVVATIAAKGGRFIAPVKARPDIETITVTAEMGRDRRRAAKCFAAASPLVERGQANLCPEPTSPTKASCSSKANHEPSSAPADAIP